MGQRLAMKMTLEIPDKLLREMKARSALASQPMRAFVIEALEEHLHGQQRVDPDRAKGWRSVFGKAPKKAADDIQAVVDREFSNT
jgi:hypothetical protein